MQTSVRYESGRLWVADGRVFRSGRIRLAQALIDELMAETAVRSVELDLTSGTCRIRWNTPEISAAEAAATYTTALAAARLAEVTAGVSGCCGDRKGESLWLACRLDNGVLLARGEAIQSGRLRLRVVGVPDGYPWADVVRSSLAQCPRITSVRTRHWRSRLELDFDSDRLTRAQVLDALTVAWRTAGVKARPAPIASSELIARGPRRWVYLALGVGSFGLAVLGLLLPGVPTVPFLLASSYFLARSSRRLHRRLLDSRVFGRLLREWRTYRALSRESKRRLAGFVVTAIVISTVFAPLNPALLMTVAAMAVLSLYGIHSLPELASRASPAPA
ncbi:YbaN family protein [Methylolobus aquaticus]